jgi:uncharacterized protein (DUF1501 family)
MNTTAPHSINLQTEASESGTPMSDITSDAVPIFADATVAAETLEALTVSQTAKILGIGEQKVVHLIADHTLCCMRTDEAGSPLLDASCVQAQAGKTKADFLGEVRRIISAENAAHAPVTNAQSPLEQLFAGLSEVTDADDANEIVRVGEASSSLVDAKNVTHVQLKSFDRRAITAKNVQSILTNLESANVRLEAAMYRAGYLESKVENLEEKLKDVPELRTKAARSLIFEKENADLRATIAKHETELIEVHQMLDRLRQSWWWSAWSWIFGVRI